MPEASNVLDRTHPLGSSIYDENSINILELRSEDKLLEGTCPLSQTTFRQGNSEERKSEDD
jgi:hypothetical protein